MISGRLILPVTGNLKILNRMGYGKENKNKFLVMFSWILKNAFLKPMMTLIVEII